MGGGINKSQDRRRDLKKARKQVRYRTIHQSAQRKTNNNPPQKARRLKLIGAWRTNTVGPVCCVEYERTIDSIFLFLEGMIMRSTLEGYEPDADGVKHSQNNCCNESWAIVLTLRYMNTQN